MGFDKSLLFLTPFDSQLESNPKHEQLYFFFLGQTSSRI